MAISGTLDKLVWGGKLCGVESWSCSVHLLHPGPADVVAPLAAMTTAVVNWFQSPGLVALAGAELEYVKFNAVDPATGRYLDPAHSNTLEFPNPGPSSNAVPAPPQLSVCVSLVTASARGLASKGRFYPPSPGQGEQGTGHVSQLFIDQYLADQISLIQAFNGLVSGGQVVVFSAKGQVAQVVTAVRVGDVVDTQRRRRKSLVEKYTSAVV